MRQAFVLEPFRAEACERMVSNLNLPSKCACGATPTHTQVHLLSASPSSSSSAPAVQSTRFVTSFSYRRIALLTPSTTTITNESSIATHTPGEAGKEKNNKFGCQRKEKNNLT